jgi:hypothetical protein
LRVTIEPSALNESDIWTDVVKVNHAGYCLPKVAHNGVPVTSAPPMPYSTFLTVVLPLSRSGMAVAGVMPFGRFDAGVWSVIERMRTGAGGSAVAALMLTI